MIEPLDTNPAPRRPRRLGLRGLLTLAFVATGLILCASLALVVDLTARRDLETALERRGRSYATQVAGQVRPAVVAGNAQQLRESLSAALANDREVEFVEILSADGHRLMFVPGGAGKGPGETRADVRDQRTFVAAIRAEGPVDGGVAAAESGRAVSPAIDRLLGEVRVVMDARQIHDQSALAALLIVGLVFGVGSFGLRYGFRRLVHPMLRLARAAEEVGRGNFALRVPVSAPAELGELEVSFNNMVRALARQEEESLLRQNEDLAESLRRSQTLYDELKRTQETMLKAEKLRAVGEMASGVAHDFNNMLTAILGRAQLAHMKLTNGQVDRDRLLLDMQIILQSAEDGARTVQRLQQYTRGELQTDLQPVDLNLVAQQALEMTKPRWQWVADSGRRPIEVFNKVPAGLAAAASEGDLREVLVNLINNAVDAMPLGGRVDLSAAEENGRVRLQVRDTGTGMDAETQKRIFDPFFTTKGIKGTGLGLSIARSIIKRLGGRIEIDSRLSEGTCFTIELGVCREKPESRSGSGPAPAGDDPRPDPSCPRWDILIVDDNTTALENLRLILEHLGQRVTAVDTGQAAIQLMKATPFDLVISDLGMPEVTGWDVAQAASELPNPPPVVLCTGWGREISADDARIAGVWRVLAKPYLMTQIEELMHGTGEAREPQEAA